VAQGAGVGGGSLIYANIFIDAEPFAFEKDWPAEITFEELKPYYEKTGKVINPKQLPDNQLTERAKLMKIAAENIGEGARYRKLDLAVSFSENWHYDLDDPFNEAHSHSYINPQGVEQGTCVHCGNCDIGCQVRAKNTLDLNYIPLAEQYGAVVKPLHLVEKISPLSESGYRVDFDVIDADAEVLRPGSINAKKVIVAAGTMGTNALMLKCRDQYGTLPKLSNELGKNWSSNGDFLTPAVYSGKDISPTRGPTISSAIDFLDGSKNGNRFFVEDGGFPDVLGNALEKYSGSTMGFMANSISAAIRDRNPVSCIMPWFGQAVDAADGVMSLKRSWIPPFRKKMNLDWNIDRSESAIQAMVDMHKELSAATGGKPLVPASWKYLKDLVTPHALGGCKMGSDASNGVVNHKGEVFGYPDLYIADGSIFPVAIGLNPSKTIAALAERIADHIND
ncbi:MAG: GMC oxidoreductase, partial [Gammaproteobacteria bacterium]|nr:GMC oxidoreductase [Gammaproteobacteria bacterium]